MRLIGVLFRHLKVGGINFELSLWGISYVLIINLCFGANMIEGENI